MAALGEVGGEAFGGFGDGVGRSEADLVEPFPPRGGLDGGAQRRAGQKSRSA